MMKKILILLMALMLVQVAYGLKFEINNTQELLIEEQGVYGTGEIIPQHCNEPNAVVNSNCTQVEYITLINGMIGHDLFNNTITGWQDTKIQSYGMWASMNNTAWIVDGVGGFKLSRQQNGSFTDSDASGYWACRGYAGVTYDTINNASIFQIDLLRDTTGGHIVRFNHDFKLDSDYVVYNNTLVTISYETDCSEQWFKFLDDNTVRYIAHLPISPSTLNQTKNFTINMASENFTFNRIVIYSQSNTNSIANAPEFSITGFDIGNATNVTVGNQMPVIIGVNPVPSTQEININVAWGVTITDDGFASDIYSGFDCDDDGSLEFPLALRGTSVPVFNCTYSTVGTKGGRAFATDVQHTNQTVELANTVEIIDSGIGGIANCTGFTAPTCTGSCYFLDDFNYNYSILCNGWQTLNNTPVNGQLIIYSPSFGSQLYLSRITNPIKRNDYSTFTIEFDFKDASDTQVYFQVYDEDISNLLINLQFSLGNIYHYDNIPPYTELIGTYNEGELNHIKATINYNTGLIQWDYGNGTEETEFADSGTISAGYYTYNWVTAGLLNFTIDNFLIEYGIVQSLTFEEEVEIEETLTYLTTGNFCGINWTSRRFIDEECVARGYDMPESLNQVCLIRACISDSSAWIFTKALQNLFKTLILVVALLLLAPLFIALVTRRR